MSHTGSKLVWIGGVVLACSAAAAAYSLRALAKRKRTLPPSSASNQPTDRREPIEQQEQEPEPELEQQAASSPHDPAKSPSSTDTTVATSPSAALSPSSAASVDSATPPVALVDPFEWKPFPLISKTQVTHNTLVLRFALPPGTTLGLPIGKHIHLRYREEDGTEVTRPYTPISSDAHHIGFFDLLIKVYDKGKMSQHLHRMQIGESILVRGPSGKFQFKPRAVKAYGMIAGGTGITPMLQVIRALLRDPEDPAEIRLIFGNVTADDILLKSDLDKLAETYPRFHVYYTLNQPPENWTGGSGNVSLAMIQAHLPPPSVASDGPSGINGGVEGVALDADANEEVQVLVCGPPPMVKAMRDVALPAAGFRPSQVFCF